MVIAFVLMLRIFGSSTLGVVLFLPVQFRNINVTYNTRIRYIN